MSHTPLPTELIVLSHPLTEDDWKPYILNFHEMTDTSSTFRESLKTVTEIAEPILKSTIEIEVEDLDDYPARWVIAITRAIFIHLYIAPDNKAIQWLQGKCELSFRELKAEGIINEVNRLLTRLNSDQEFLALYLYCERNQIDVSHQLKSIRNRLLHPLGKNGHPNDRPRFGELYKANLRLRQSIHAHAQGLIKPVKLEDQLVQIVCGTCQRSKPPTTPPET